ncbi:MULTISPECIES: RCC1 domain-containing protein [Streptomyces]|uniref:Chromosome condensation regulator RCC1 n=1 Tax=Streptomyces viridochromogenes TaxID=1938 RepID=A0A0L8J2D5_STRVR|nr:MULTISPECIES: chromosome condensation regulator RCC1 [Streptomyces]KOG07791.1 chromosome condensation regulator RCC1 [Streptomyces viridochromogenes]
MTYAYVRGLATALVLVALTGRAHAEPRDPWVRAWGLNNAGQLGNGSTLDQRTPAPVRGLARNDVRELAAGGASSNRPFAVAVLQDGTVRSWGGNDSGQLGDGTTTERGFPGSVAGLDGVSDVAAGHRHALAVRKGRVLAWGYNAHGQLGNGSTAQSTDPPITRPVAVQSLDRVKDIASGCDHAVALREDGTVWTWGANQSGQLGIGSTTSQNTPKRVAGLQDVVSVAAGCLHSVVLLADGTVRAWGRNANGQLGIDSTENSPVPVEVKELHGVVRVFAGWYHTFATLDDGGVRAWGWNQYGQLGDGSSVDRTTPVPVPSLTGVTALSLGRHHTVAVLDDQSVLAWGDNGSGQLGEPGTTVSATPVGVLPAGSGTTRVPASTSWTTSYAY